MVRGVPLALRAAVHAATQRTLLRKDQSSRHVAYSMSRAFVGHHLQHGATKSALPAIRIKHVALHFVARRVLPAPVLAHVPIGT